MLGWQQPGGKKGSKTQGIELDLRNWSQTQIQTFAQITFGVCFFFIGLLRNGDRSQTKIKLPRKSSVFVTWIPV